MAPTCLTGPHADSDADTALAAPLFFHYNDSMTSLSEQKAELREQALDHRARLNPDDENPEDAVSLFFETFDLKAGSVLAGYWPIGKEFDVRFIMEESFRRGVSVCLPVVTASTTLEFCLWDGKTPLVKGTAGTWKPEQETFVDPDILLVPLLAFDRKGNRLGRGGGYYDATLSTLRLRREIIAVGVGYAAQAVLFNLPVEDHDERLDYVLTPQGLHDFRR